MIRITRHSATIAAVALRRQHRVEPYDPQDADIVATADRLDVSLRIYGEIVTVTDADAQLALRAVKAMEGEDYITALQRDLDTAHAELSWKLDLKQPFSWPGMVWAGVVVIGLILSALRF